MKLHATVEKQLDINANDVMDSIVDYLELRDFSIKGGKVLEYVDTMYPEYGCPYSTYDEKKHERWYDTLNAINVLRGELLNKEMMG